jgi:hypothetical protein
MNALQAGVSMQAWVSKAAHVAVVPGKWLLTRLWGAATEEKQSLLSRPYVLVPLAYVGCATATVLPLLAVGAAGCTAPVYAAVVRANRWRTNLTTEQVQWLSERKVADALAHVSAEHMRMLLHRLRELYVAQGAFFRVVSVVTGGGTSESSRSLVAQLGLANQAYARHDKDDESAAAQAWQRQARAAISHYLFDDRERNQGKRLYYCMFLALHALVQEPLDALVQVASLPPCIASVVLEYW